MTNTADSGAGSLRQALLDAQNCAGAPHTIAFDVPPGSLTNGVALSRPRRRCRTSLARDDYRRHDPDRQRRQHQRRTLGTGGTVGPARTASPGRETSRRCAAQRSRGPDRRQRAHRRDPDHPGRRRHRERAEPPRRRRLLWQRHRERKHRHPERRRDADRGQRHRRDGGQLYEPRGPGPDAEQPDSIRGGTDITVRNNLLGFTRGAASSCSAPGGRDHRGQRVPGVLRRDRLQQRGLRSPGNH